MYFSAILFLFSLLLSYGENLPAKWGRVKEIDFYTSESSFNIPALIICDYGRITFSNRTFYYRYTRLKINNNKGLKYAKIEIPYIYKDGYDEFVNLRVNLYLLENGKIKKVKYYYNDFKDIIIDEHRKIKYLLIKDAKPGCIIEYIYEIASLDLVKLRDWYFQNEIPVMWSGVEINVPLPITYLVTIKKHGYLSEEEQIKFTKNLEWLKNTGDIKSRKILSKNNFILYESTSGNYKVYIVNNQRKLFIMKNLEGISKVESYISVKDYYPVVKFDLFEIAGNIPWFSKPLLYTTINDYIFFSWKDLYFEYNKKGYIKYRIKSWEEFNQDLLKSKFFGGYFKRYFDYKQIFKNIYSNLNYDNDLDKIVLLYNYLTNKIKWTGNFKMYPFKEPQKLFSDEYGHSADINMFFIYLLKKLNIEAFPILIRTNDLGLPEKVFPVHGQFNHVIACVEIDGEIYLIDLTNPNKRWNELPEYDLNTYGWKVHEYDYGWIDIDSFLENKKTEKLKLMVFCNKK